MKQIAHLEDLTPDPNNANKGTPRGASFLESSLRNHGAGRSILVDRDGVVIAGNKTLEQAAAIGLDIQTVHSDGTKLVVVVRDDLTMDESSAKALAIYDNRVSEVSLSWDLPVLASLANDIDLGEFWLPDEWDRLVNGAMPEPMAVEDDQSQPEPQPVTCPQCGHLF